MQLHEYMCFRLVAKHRLITNQKSELSLKSDILIHNWASEKYDPLDILDINSLYFGSPGNDCTKDKKTAEGVGRLRRPTSCAVLGS